MSRGFYPLLLLLCHVFLRGQLVVCVCNWPKCSNSGCCSECCPECQSPTPSPTTATCNCSSHNITEPSPTTPLESQNTTPKTSPSSSINSSTLKSSCPTLVTTDCPLCSTISSVTPKYPECPDKIQQNISLSSEIQAPSPGSIIGAALGGAVLGSILTVIVFVCIRRRSHSPDDTKEELAPNVVRNAAYQYNNGHKNTDDPTSINSTYSEIHHSATRKAARISLVMRQEDKIKKEEVYNHLHESDKEDRGDYYDHAGPVPSLSIMEDGYGVLSIERENNDNYNTVDRNYSTDSVESMTAENKHSQEYFILETKN